ncbi:hypothetical protein WDU94_012581 [Cyamophila willieti]
MENRPKDLMENKPKIEDNLKDIQEESRDNICYKDNKITKQMKCDIDKDDIREKQMCAKNVWSRISLERSQNTNKVRNNREQTPFPVIHEESDPKLNTPLNDPVLKKMEEPEKIMKESVTDRKQKNAPVLRCKQYQPRDNQCIKLTIPRQNTLSSANSQETASIGFTETSMESFSTELTAFTPRRQTRGDKHIKEKIITSKRKNHCIKLHIPTYALQMEICLKSSNENPTDPDPTGNITVSETEESNATIKPTLDQHNSNGTTDSIPSADIGNHGQVNADEKKINTKGIYVESDRCPKVDNKAIDNTINETEPNIQNTDNMAGKQLNEYIERAQCIVQEIEHRTASLNQILCHLKSISNPA